MIEYDDLLKRPLEHYKYLLTTVERAALSMTNTTLFLDLAFIGSCNDIHLGAFREIPDFQSFKGRIELVRVPFILDVRHEEALYRERLREAAGKPTSPRCGPCCRGCASRRSSGSPRPWPR